MPKKVLKKVLLYPLAGLYGLGVGVRNAMFKIKILRRRKFDIPVIVVGNIAVGGTGKTPHTEYIISLLMERYKVGVISRGYGRKTHGYRDITPESTPREVGDEPYQMYQKYKGKNVCFAVCENRCEGIDMLREHNPGVQVIVLDDAFQHRYVMPSVAIVLTEFGRPFFLDSLLPYGRLREPATAIENADLVVVTKCPANIRPIEYRIFKNQLSLYPYQKLFFSRFVYCHPEPVFPDYPTTTPELNYLCASDTLLAIAGIANPRPFVEYVKSHKAKVAVKIFPDHHDFSKADIEVIIEKFKGLPGRQKFMITTEKDAVRLRNNPAFPDKYKAHIFYIPVRVEFDPGLTPEDTFNTTLLELIKNSRTLKLKKKND